MLNKVYGFTLLEILVALMVFTVLSLILVNALHNVIQVHERTELTAQRLRRIQLVWLLVSRDVEQMVERPVKNNDGDLEVAFVGDRDGFAFTHTGMSDLTNQSSLQRCEYRFKKPDLMRVIWPVLDRSPETKPATRTLLSAENVTFEYFDDQGKLSKKWPKSGVKAALPHAVRISLELKEGKMSQTYVIPAESNKLIDDQTQKST